MHSKAIEAAARAVMLARPNGGCIVQDWQREAQDNPHVETAMKQAQAAVQAYLAAMEAEGFGFVQTRQIKVVSGPPIYDPRPNVKG